jgi:multimeric flavodoxin WrbA
MNKALMINGSPNQHGATHKALELVASELQPNGVSVDFLQLGGELIHGCRACGVCRKVLNKRCFYNDDIINIIIEKMFEADAIIIGSPTYFGNVTTEIKALIDRTGYVARGNAYMFSGKIASAVVTCAHAGAVNVINALNLFFTTNDMPIASSCYWPMIVATPQKELDDTGKRAMKKLGQNITEMLK